MNIVIKFQSAETRLAPSVFELSKDNWGLKHWRHHAVAVPLRVTVYVHGTSIKIVIL
jgi:hypothetical protein